MTRNGRAEFGGVGVVQLSTPDVAASRAFYLALSDDGTSERDRSRDRLAQFEFLATEQPASWLVEFTVSNVGSAVDSCVALGATVVDESPTTVALVDPRGVRFALTEPARAADPSIHPGSVYIADLYTRDVEWAVGFYAEALDLELKVLPDDPVDYMQFLAQDRHVLGVLDVTSFLDDESPDQWLPYLSFADVDAAIARATALGARVVGPATASPTGRYAIIRDPQGVLVGLWDSFSLLS
ncbi:MAG TPA: VOC family protein [Pseudolysinimonas sp.]|nr:VOC family protein [Pseudolysinimonas sp.]